MGQNAERSGSKGLAVQSAQYHNEVLCDLRSANAKGSTSFEFTGAGWLFSHGIPFVHENVHCQRGMLCDRN